VSNPRLAPAVLVSLFFALVLSLVVYGAEDLGVINGGFEVDPPTITSVPWGWTLATSSNGVVVATHAHSGSQSLQCSLGAKPEYYQAIDVSSHADQTITVSGWMYTVGGGAPGGIQAAIADSSACNVSAEARTPIGDAAEELPTEQWTQFQGSLTVPSSASGLYLCIFLWSESSDLYMDDIGATVEDPTCVGLSRLSADHAGARVTLLTLAAILIGGAAAALRAWELRAQSAKSEEHPGPAGS